MGVGLFDSELKTTQNLKLLENILLVQFMKTSLNKILNDVPC